MRQRKIKVKPKPRKAPTKRDLDPVRPEADPRLKAVKSSTGTKSGARKLYEEERAKRRATYKKLKAAKAPLKPKKKVSALSIPPKKAPSKPADTGGYKLTSQADRDAGTKYDTKPKPPKVAVKKKRLTASQRMKAQGTIGYKNWH